MTTQTLCPICHQPPIKNIDLFDLVDCVSCHVFWTYINEPVVLDDLYKDKAYQVVDNRGSIFEKIVLRESEKILKKASDMLPRKNLKLLDFGSGKGQFLFKAKQLGWYGVGVETAPGRASFGKSQYGISVISENFPAVDLENELFDMVTFNHVLEHLVDPIDTLITVVSSNLHEDGVLYIEVPRINSWQSKISGSNWMHLDIPKHLTHWKKETLQQVLKKNGFYVISCRQFSIHLGVLGMLQALMSRTGYKGNIIVDLKSGKKNVEFMVKLVALTPVAFLLEILAIPFESSGIFGLYAKKMNIKK